MALVRSLDWGDGSPPSTAVAEDHTYTSDGSYTQVLTVTDADTGLFDTDSRVVVVGVAANPDSMGAVTVTPSTGAPPLEVVVVIDPATSGAVTFDYNFGDGSPPALGQPSTSASHSYGSPGEFKARVTGYDATGASVGASPQPATVVVSVPSTTYDSVRVDDQLTAPGVGVQDAVGRAVLRVKPPVGAPAGTAVWRTDTHETLMAERRFRIDADAGGLYSFDVAPVGVLRPIGSVYEIERSVDGGAREFVTFAPDGSQPRVWLNDVRTAVPVALSPGTGLADLADTAPLRSAGAGQVPVFDAARGLWVPGDLVTGGSIGAHSHGELDVVGLDDALAAKVDTTDPRLTNARTPTGGAGGVLSGQFPSPGFAVDMATQGELDAEIAARQAADALLIPVAQKGATSGVVPLGADTKIPTVYLPQLAVVDTFPVASQAAMLALVAQRGDLAIRSDLNKTFSLAADDPTVLANWLEHRTPTDLVLSVQGRTGAVDLADLFAALNHAARHGPGAADDLTTALSAVSAPVALAAAAALGVGVGFARSGHVHPWTGLERTANKDQAGGYPGLDAGGKISTLVLPPLAINDTFTVTSQAAMLALTAQRGDAAVRTDLAPAQTFLLAGDDPTVLASWVQITTVGAIVSVDGRTGAVDLSDRYALKTLLDAKGDLFVATADNTPARLAVGTDGQRLVADSSTATGLAWRSTPATTHTMRAGQDTWPSQPIAVTEYLGSPAHRLTVDLTGYSQIRLVGNVATASSVGTAQLFLQFSTDGGTTWANFDGSVNTSVGAPLILTASTGTKASGWQAIPAAAQADVQVRIAGKASAATGSPVINSVGFQVK